MSYKDDSRTDYKELALEAMEILSNPRINKGHKDRLREVIKDICRQFGDTATELRSLELAGLNGRDKMMLARLQSLHSRVVNIQVCSDCKEYFDTVLEETKYI
jgi:hypothetical protein